MTENCDRMDPLLSGLLDDELTQQDRQRVELHLEQCATCRDTVQELTRQREEIGALDCPQPNEQQWSQFMSVTASQGSRSVGWILAVAGAVVLAGFAAWQFSVDRTVPALVKVGVLALCLGLGLLFVSVLLDRLSACRTDRYRNVER